MAFDGLYCDGKLRVVTGAIEMRMSHTVCPPAVTLVRTGEFCLNMVDTLWDLCGLEEQPTGLRLNLREYPGDRPDAFIEVDAETGQLTVAGVVTQQSELENALDAR